MQLSSQVLRFSWLNEITTILPWSISFDVFEIWLDHETEHN